MRLTQTSVAYLWLSCLLALLSWAADDKGEVIPLKAGATSFTGILKQPRHTKPKGAFLLLPDAGGQPNQTGLIESLRIELALHTWATLAIQLPEINVPPTTDSDKKQQEIQARLESGIAYLQTQKISPIVIVAYGTSAPVTLQWLATQHAPACAALVLIGAYPWDKKPSTPEATPPKYTQIQIPILDIVAADDYDIVTQAATVRAMQFNAADNRHYQAYLINGADHNDAAMYGVIAHKIRGWLRKHKVMEASAFS